MSRIVAAVAGVCLAACPVQAWAQGPSSASASAEAAVPAGAMQLARLLNPRDKLVEVSVRALEFGFIAQIENSPDDAAVFKQYPGLDRAILDAVRPIVSKHVAADYPMIVRRSAEFYARRFSSSEIDELIDFYGSSTGNKLIQGMYAGADFGKLMDGLTDTGEAQFTGDHVQDFARSTVTRISPIFDKSDHAYLATFGKTPLYAKLKAALPGFQQLMAEIANAPTPEMDAEIQQAIESTLERFVRQHQARSST